MVIEPSGKAHGVLFLNSNAMGKAYDCIFKNIKFYFRFIIRTFFIADIILQPTPAITYRTIGGIFDMYFFMGPTPTDVLKQYAEIVGKPFFPPYWSLGFHLCKYGYKTLEQTKAVWKRTRNALIPFVSDVCENRLTFKLIFNHFIFQDTQWNDLDYMDKNNDFTYDKTKFKDLPNFIKELHDVSICLIYFYPNLQLYMFFFFFRLVCITYL